MEWNAETTWLFAVELLEWQDSESLAPFPDAVPNRSDAQLVDFFRDRGVPNEQIIYLQDSEATLDAIRSSLPEFLSNTDENALLILYFAGHGGWYPSVVKKAWYGLHQISYDGYDEIWDEWVGPDRLRELA